MNDKAVWDGLVIYSEGGSYAPYMRPMIDALAQTYDARVFYLTSDAADPLLTNPPAHVKPFFIGKGSMRTHVFSHMRARVLAMTMPDLNTFHIKRSPKVGHYTYFHHSLVSTQMVYRKGAFDHFDSMMCVGPYHRDEVREWEAAQGLPAKQFFDHGSPPLDTLIAAADDAGPLPLGEGKQLSILVAPSWGPEGIMETRAQEIVSVLLEAGHYVRVRPHPRTRQIAGPVLNELAAKFADHPSFDMNEDISGHDALMRSHVMISDWSGVAMEFAFGLNRPVVFIDVPRKINNPDYETLEAVPLEVSYREEVGAVVQPDRLETLPAILAALIEDDVNGQAKRAKMRDHLFYNLRSSGHQGAVILAQITRETEGDISEF